MKHFVKNMFIIIAIQIAFVVYVEQLLKYLVRTRIFRNILVDAMKKKAVKPFLSLLIAFTVSQWI